ncbi:MAG: D-alanyl-D-alanine carboxypeptidase [Oscillospiraceae bacterium]|nr:D-alanyl-D-alanine carboxypeptidase [Oscillospiraceae bacterium]
MIKKVSLWLLILAVCLTLSPAAASADGEPYALTVTVNGAPRAVRAYDGTYEGNIYLSLTDLAAALSGTEKQFRFERVVSSTEGEYFTVSMGQMPVLGSGAGGISGQTSVAVLNLFRNRLLVDGSERKYYTCNPQNGDLYMSLIDVQLMLDMTIERSGKALTAKPAQPFLPDAKALRDEGYFDNISSVYLADADSGEVLFLWNGYSALPAASLSKLLSYLVLKEAISAGEIHQSDMVRISEQAQALSRSADGIVPMEAGAYVPFQELVEAMLVASSNEAALALAEHLCGSEEAFVERMNARARELGLYSVVMYNCNGLPSYSDGNVPVKRQNLMSAADLYLLTQLIIQQYPEITEITSTTLAHFPDLNDYWTANSNPLIYNMEGVTGLKTGSTNKAGYCLVATMPVAAGDEAHNIVLVLLGAESADIRGQASEILMRYARSLYR